MNRLQVALLRNALFSGLSGVLLVLFNSRITDAFALYGNKEIFVVIGWLLLFFTATIAYEFVQQRHNWVMWIIIQDLLWVLGSIVLLLLRPFGISAVGNVAITVVACIVAFMGYSQYMALHERTQS